MARGKKKPTEELVQLEAELAPQREEGSQVLTYLSSLVIESAEQSQQVADFCAALAGRRKELENKQKTITDPLHATLKAVRAVFGPLIETYDAAERAGKQAVIRAVNAAAERERAALAEVATTGNAAPVLAVVENAIPKPQGMVIRTRKVAEVVDRDAAMQHLCELYLAGFRVECPLVIDEVALRRMEHSAAEQIRGVAIVEKQS